MAGRLSAAAHMIAVWPIQCSVLLTSAPCFRSTFAAATLSVRATTIRAVWPSGLGKSTCAPALRSFSNTVTLPVMAASDIGLAP